MAEKYNNNIKHTTMLKYLGVLLIVIGTIMLVVSYISGFLVDMNIYQFAAMALIILGVVAHIILIKKCK